MSLDPPIYLNVRDRVRDLRNLVEWLERAGHQRIVLIDNASTYPPLLEYLDASPHRVVRLGRNVGARSLWDAEMVPDEAFVFSDPDVIPVDECPLDAVAYLAELLGQFPRWPKAALGPYLDKVPDDGDGVQVGRSFYHDDRRLAPGVFGAVSDTTFALYRPGSEFTLAALLTGYPYQFDHPPWYIDIGEADEEDRYYLERASAVGGTGSMWARRRREVGVDDLPVDAHATDEPGYLFALEPNGNVRLADEMKAYGTGDPPLTQFYHCWAHGEWEKPLREHFTALDECGFDGPLYVGLVGSAEERDAAARVIHDEFGRKFGAIIADEGYEQVTLDAIWRYAQHHDGAILYAHTKGAYRIHESQNLWRWLMTREIVMNWRDHLAALDGADAVGWYWTDWGPKKSARFFAGNYWLANCNYLRTLPDPMIYEGRSMAELWLGLRYPRVVNVVSLLPDGTVPKMSWRTFAEETGLENEPKRVKFLSKPTVTVVIPTVPGREWWIERTLRGYEERTKDANLEVVIIKNKPTCGVAWRAGFERATGEYILLAADDIVPGENWLPPLLEVVRDGAIPCATTVRADDEVLDDDGYPLDGNPLPTAEAPVPTAFLFNRDSHPDDVPDGYESPDWDLGEYPSEPFASREQWWALGEMIVPQYGGDKWVGFRAREEGIRIVSRPRVYFYHYHSPVSRDPREDGWLWSDRMDFDLTVAFPQYMAGALKPGEFHPQWNTVLGRDLARAWRRLCTPPPYPWEPGWEKRFELAESA